MSYSGRVSSLLHHYRSFDQQRTEQIKAGLHDYSLLAAVLPVNDEERLHTRFIYSMINPAGLHYLGNRFLSVFLQQLPEQLRDFINIEQAVVEREKDQIDLLIHDGERYLIIENKLNAADQKYQITRYIKHVRDRYLSEHEEISGRIAVIYLSKSKKKPSKESNSLAGFKLVEQQLIWQGLTDEDSIKKLEGINLAKGQAIPFVHMGYSPEIERWASKCMINAPDGINSAFKDYLAVLKRINHQDSWRNVMTLDQYALQLKKEDQEDVYAFMVDAQESLVNFISIKLHQELLRIFNIGEFMGNTELTACKGQPHLITPRTIKNWLNKKGNRDKWKNITCYTEITSGVKVGLLLGTRYATVSVLDSDGKVDYSELNRIGKGSVRSMLLEKKGLYDFVRSIEDRLKKLGCEQGPYVSA